MDLQVLMRERGGVCGREGRRVGGGERVVAEIILQRSEGWKDAEVRDEDGKWVLNGIENGIQREYST